VGGLPDGCDRHDAGPAGSAALNGHWQGVALAADYLCRQNRPTV
jgi:hypothetical protein